jgi:enoyl-CoA hydratase/carnithine racemase
MSEAYETILFEKGDDHVATVTINRPQVLNSFNLKMCSEFQALWRRVGQDNDIHTVVLRAAPGRAFSTGFDVRSGDKILGHDNMWTQTDPGDRLGPKQNKCWKPVITAVHGMCAGGAFYWVNESDIVMCSADAEFFDPHVTYGMAAALEPIGLRWRIQLGEVLRMALLGNDERITAETALRIGLVTEVVEGDGLWKRAHALAASIAAKPAIAVQATVRAIWESLDQTRSAALAGGLKFPQLANPLGTAQVDRWAIMETKQSYERR